MAKIKPTVTAKPKTDIFSIRVTTEQKEMLQALLEEAEMRVNKGRNLDQEYKIRKNDIALEVLTKHVPRLKPDDFD